MTTQSVTPAHVLTFPNMNPRITQELEAEAIVQLTRALAYKIHQVAFERLSVDEREEMVNAAVTAWHTVQDVLSGKAARIPEWERQCLTFSGPYDLELVQAIPTGEVQ
jgi:hypothetical protein